MILLVLVLVLVLLILLLLLIIIITMKLLNVMIALLRSWPLAVGPQTEDRRTKWVFITGACSGREVQSMGVASYNKTAYNIVQTTTPCFHCTPL